MLDLYGWESVFYVSGLLSVMWAYCMWKYLLKGEGKRSAVSVPSFHAPILHLLICLIVLVCAHVPVSVLSLRSYNHTGVPGQWWDPVENYQKTLATAPKTTCGLVR